MFKPLKIIDTPIVPNERVLFWDIETSPLKAWLWHLGEQVIRHDQLCEGHKYVDIICITYCFNDGKPAKSLDWGYHKQDSGPMIEKFDKIITNCDVAIGKNSDRFDNKHLNTMRFLKDLPGMPDWIKYTDDLEKQMRKYFNFPSNALDYVSDLLGLGGKIKMERQQWIDIVEKRRPAALQEMITYGKKDVEDTRAIWNMMSSHFEPRHKAVPHSRLVGDSRVSCKQCGSTNLINNGIRWSNGREFQRYECKECHRYAGKAPISAKGRIGNIS